MSVPKNGTRITQVTHNAFETPPMSSRRKTSISANPHIIARGRKIRKRKKVSQNVVATIVGLLRSSKTACSPDRRAALPPPRGDPNKRGGGDGKRPPQPQRPTSRRGRHNRSALRVA